MRVVVKMEVALGPTLTAWRRSLSPDPDTRRALASVYLDEFRQRLVRHTDAAEILVRTDGRDLAGLQHRRLGAILRQPAAHPGVGGGGESSASSTASISSIVSHFDWSGFPIRRWSSAFCSSVSFGP